MAHPPTRRSRKESIPRITNSQKEFLMGVGLHLSGPYSDMERSKKTHDFQILWETNRYDGPLCGMCLWDGRWRWFDYEKDTQKCRVFNIRALSRREILWATFSYFIFWLWVRKIRYGWRVYYWLFPPRWKRYAHRPIVGKYQYRGKEDP